MSRWPSAMRVRPSRGWPWLAAAAVIAVAGCQTERLPSEPGAESQEEDQLSASAQAAGVGADDWIVVFKKGTLDPPGLAKKLTTQHGGTVSHTYSHAIQGFAGQLPAQAIDGIRQNPNVDFVERDGVVHTTDVGSWGLDRIDQRDLPLSNTYSAAGDGSGVDVYIIDTGIDFSTYDGGSQFESRLDQGRDRDYVDDDYDASDCHGHGTHVAGTVGSTGYGVAPGVTLIGVRVLNCQGSGSYSDVIAGIEHAATTAASSGKPSVANMSLGGGFSSAVNDAVNQAVADGMVFAVSSGNSNTDACNQSPASAASAITVNASTSSDARSSFSNYGTCTDIFAPGSGITSTIIGGGTPQAWSGTSMASPHVAGVAALILKEGVAAADVWPTMQDRATRAVISGANGSPNLLLYSGTTSGDPCAGGGCGTAKVQSITDVDMKINRNRRTSGTVTVTVIDEKGVPLGGVVVSGTWTVTNGSDRASSGTTGSTGTVTLESGSIRNATGFRFCVTALSKGGYVDGSDGECDGFDNGTGSPGDPEEPGVVPVGTLEGSSAPRGKNFRANLSWGGGGSTVQILRGPSSGSLSVLTTVSNSNAYTDNVGKTPPAGGYWYQVCNTGSASDCSNEARVTF